MARGGGLLASDGAIAVAPARRDGRIVAVLSVSEKWLPDKDLEAREVYRTLVADLRAQPT